VRWLSTLPGDIKEGEVWATVKELGSPHGEPSACMMWPASVPIDLWLSSVARLYAERVDHIYLDYPGWVAAITWMVEQRRYVDEGYVPTHAARYFRWNGFEFRITELEWRRGVRG
jgi:hypothetical protein